VASIYTNGQRFETLKTIGADGRPVVGAPAMIDGAVQGADRLRVLALRALQECAAGLREPPLPVLVCAPPLEGFARDARLLDRLLDGTGLAVDRPASRVLAPGRGTTNDALALAGSLLLSEVWPACLLVAVDSLIAPPRLSREVAAGRVAGAQNPTGFVPGEAGAALLLSLRPEIGCAAIIAGGGHCAGGETPSAVLSLAAVDALADAHVPARALGAICHDGPGDWAQLEELALADGRPPLSLAAHAPRFIPAVTTGEVGAAAGVLSIATLAYLLMSGVLQRPALAMFSSDGPARGTAVLVPAGSRLFRAGSDG
jgi:3-oxoacyl-[acyl-carrier-protein] synthase-1